MWTRNTWFSRRSNGQQDAAAGLRDVQNSLSTLLKAVKNEAKNGKTVKNEQLTEKHSKNVKKLKKLFTKKTKKH